MCHFKKDIGEFMQQYDKDQSVKDVPRCLLIRSYFGKKIGLSTPLLKWYLEHGLDIINIYTVVEYIPNAAFNGFMTQVAQARPDGDHDKDKSLIAETMKLIGNPSYGSKLITNKQKHHDIVYVDQSKISTEIMDEHFYSLTELPNGYYEVENTKKKINLNLTIHLGVFILNYAKLRMLEFYDVLNYYLHREDFETVEMDTDSNYLSISAENVEDLINQAQIKRRL